MSTAANLNVYQQMPQPDDFAVGMLHLDESLCVTGANDICLQMLDITQENINNTPELWAFLAGCAEFYWPVGSPTIMSDFTRESLIDAVSGKSCGLKTNTDKVLEIQLSRGAGSGAMPVMMMRNITRILNTDNVSSVSYERFRDYSEIASDWFWETDDELRFTMITNSVRKYNGDLDPSVYYGKQRQMLPIGDPDEEAKWQQHFDDMAAHRPFRNFEYCYIDQHREKHYWSISGAPFYHRNGDFGGYRGIGRDVSDRRDLEMELARRVAALEELKDEFEMLAMTDSLTGVANRRAFRTRATDELNRVNRYKTPASLLMLDMDLFKQINDTFGHEGGDFVLKEFVSRVSGFLRNTDIFGRLGGEEFAILLPMTGQEGLKIVANRILQSLRERPVVWNDQEIWFTASAGGTQLQPGDNTIDKALARADQAMYKSKRGGRDQLQMHDG